MQGSKRHRWSGHTKNLDWKKIRKVLHEDIFWDSNRFRYFFDCGAARHHFLLDNKIVYSCWHHTAYYNPSETISDYNSLGFLYIVDHHLNIKKDKIFDYTLSKQNDPRGLHNILKAADRRIGKRRLVLLANELVLENLLEGSSVTAALKIINTRL